MPASTIRISEHAHATLTHLAKESGSTLQEVLNAAIENHRRRALLDRANAAYSDLRKDARAWKRWKKELSGLDATLGDGL